MTDILLINDLQIDDSSRLPIGLGLHSSPEIPETAAVVSTARSYTLLISKLYSFVHENLQFINRII